MGTNEVRLYIRGMAKRHRAGWEQSRLLCRLVYKVATGEDLDMEYPWDELKDEESGETEEEVSAAWERAKAAERAWNENRKKDEKSEMENTVQDAE